MVPMKLNVGCGQTLLPGYVNVDLHGGEVRADIRHLPFRGDVFDEVFTSHILEHVIELDRAMRELHRVLKPNGTLIAKVPYGLESLYDPFHVHAFDKKTFYHSTSQPRGLQFTDTFYITRQEIRSLAPPFAWHITRYARWVLPLWDLVNGKIEFPFTTKELTALLVKR